MPLCVCTHASMHIAVHSPKHVHQQSHILCCAFDVYIHFLTYLFWSEFNSWVGGDIYIYIYGCLCKSAAYLTASQHLLSNTSFYTCMAVPTSSSTLIYWSNQRQKYLFFQQNAGNFSQTKQIVIKFIILII